MTRLCNMHGRLFMTSSTAALDVPTSPEELNDQDDEGKFVRIAALAGGVGGGLVLLTVFFLVSRWRFRASNKRREMTTLTSVVYDVSVTVDANQEGDSLERRERREDKTDGTFKDHCYVNVSSGDYVNVGADDVGVEEHRPDLTGSNRRDKSELPLPIDTSSKMPYLDKRSLIYLNDELIRKFHSLPNKKIIQTKSADVSHNNSPLGSTTSVYVNDLQTDASSRYWNGNPTPPAVAKLASQSTLIISNSSLFEKASSSLYENDEFRSPRSTEARRVPLGSNQCRQNGSGASVFDVQSEDAAPEEVEYATIPDTSITKHPRAIWAIINARKNS